MATSRSRAYEHVKNLHSLVLNPNPGSNYTPPFGKPNTPTITAPTNGGSSNGQGFMLSTYGHPNSVEQRSIQIQRAKDAGFTDTVLTSAPTLNTTTSISAEALPNYGVWYARARYIDAFGQPSEWSATVNFTAVSAPVVKAQARSGSSGAASHGLTFTGAAIGDLIILACASNSLPNLPSGFTLQGTYTSVLSGSNVYMYSKIATANNEAVTFTTTGAGDVIGTALQYASAYPTSTFAQAKATGTSFPVNIPTGGTGKWALVMGFCRSPSSSITMPAGAGWTTIYNLSTQSGSSYFAPLIAWTASLAAGNITRQSATYETWHITFNF